MPNATRRAPLSANTRRGARGVRCQERDMLTPLNADTGCRTRDAGPGTRDTGRGHRACGVQIRDTRHETWKQNTARGPGAQSVRIPGAKCRALDEEARPDARDRHARKTGRWRTHGACKGTDDRGVACEDAGEMPCLRVNCKISNTYYAPCQGIGATTVLYIRGHIIQTVCSIKIEETSSRPKCHLSISE